MTLLLWRGFQTPGNYFRKDRSAYEGVRSDKYFKVTRRAGGIYSDRAQSLCQMALINQKLSGSLRRLSGCPRNKEGRAGIGTAGQKDDPCVGTVALDVVRTRVVRELVLPR
jgi:hypothetical protein